MSYPVGSRDMSGVIFLEVVMIYLGGSDEGEDFHIYGKSIIWEILRYYDGGFIEETYI